MYEFLFDIAWVKAARTDDLTLFFKIVTWFGYTTFYMIFLSVGYWLWSYRSFTRLAFLITISAIINAYLKDYWQDPRPIYPGSLDPKAEGFGLPSGHAQISATLWFWLSYEMRKLWLWLVSAVVVGLICVSRLYLGVHDMHDVLVGLAIAIGLIALFRKLPLREYVSSRRPLRWEPIVGLIGFQALLFILWPGDHGPGGVAALGGFALGFLVGADLARRAGCRRPGAAGGRLLLAVLGVAGLFGLYSGVTEAADAIDPDGVMASYAGSILVGLYISYAAPFLYKQVGGAR